jgi:hypothetical protein
MDGEPLFFSATHLGLALFGLNVLVLGSLSVSRFAPNVIRQRPVTGAVEQTTADILKSRLRIELGLTLVLVAAAIWIVMAARHGRDDKNWAYGTLLVLLGYWLKF